MILDVIDGKLQCVTYTPIENCKTHNQIAPLKCLVCQSHYYASDNKCVQVNTEIANCDVYSDQITCLRCKQDHVL